MWYAPVNPLLEVPSTELTWLGKEMISLSPPPRSQARLTPWSGQSLDGLMRWRRN